MRAVILAAVLVFGLAGTAMAQITQPVTFNIFGRANRQIGTYTTASATIPDGVGSVQIQDTMSDQDASDPANSLILTIFVSPDGLTWIPAQREIWQGGTFVNKQGLTVPRHIDTTFSSTALRNGEWVGWQIRAELDQQVRLSVGFDCTVIPK